MSEDLSGRRLGHYRIDGVLGRGGMSVTYRATDVRLGRKVALKVIGEHLTADAEFRERFVDEARNTSAIDHANIVPLYDFDEVDGLLYIAMRLVDGSDLASHIKDGPLSPARTLTLLGQVAEALDMLHGKGLVHLDVKPANVLVTTKEAVREHVYLADFGLTRRGATGHRTRTGDFLGSPTYAAPEHLRGEPVDGRTDAYALACMLYACLSGRPPFQGGVQDVIQGHLAQEIPPLTSLVVLPPAIDDVLRKGTAKDPNQRFANCQELINAARGALAQVQRPGNPAERRQTAQSSGPQSSGPQSGGSQPPSGSIPVQQPAAPQQQPAGPPSGSVPAQQYQPQQQVRPPAYPQQPQSQYQQPHPGSQDPVRLRPPAPIGTSAFGSTSNSRPVWFLPVVVGVIAIALVVILVILLSPSDEPPSDAPGAPSTKQSIQVGEPSGSGKPLPTSVPVKTSR
ncbi:serine/threonine-protein kinase [Umezawaea sp. Da 62-37]|uniref:serine/threonine-protein kinase n=1 Tax=Umezawaea sp. Da 62-37 TaxID=3075927 RepID=UPI0028F6E67E|nr:serine/threonine-protein kinase [Umezawaea sp. Da 62-37]WNV81978.1 serine/threonine-protein kinase [Umezawaea sp. Da 62-37]